MMKSYSTSYPPFVVPPLALLISLMLGSLFPVAATAEGPAPIISKLVISGELNVGDTLNGSYRFSANAGNTVDKSTFSWGYKGETAQQVANGKMISSTGYVTPRILVSADIGRVIELSVQAKNGVGMVGNTLTLASDSEERLNTTDEGDGEGRVADPLSPAVSNLTLSGVLDVNQVLQASYSFSAGQGGSGDKSTFAWGQKGSTATLAPKGQMVANTGKPTGYTIAKADAGKILEISVQAKNGQNKTGNIQTLATDASAAAGNNTTGGNGGAVKGDEGLPTVKVSQSKAKIGETITLTVTTRDMNGNPLPSTPVTIVTTSATTRQGSNYAISLLINNQKDFTGTTGPDGAVAVSLTAGSSWYYAALETTLTITTGSGNNAKKTTQKVIFTTMSSPDSPLAQWWGHMPDTVIVGGTTFRRPPLRGEASWATDNTVSNDAEEWSGASWTSGNSHCTMPTSNQLVNAYSTLINTYKWPDFIYWTSTAINADSHYIVVNGKISSGPKDNNADILVSCSQ
ncbi:adhesion domain-containing protein [Yersinia bercovieri]|uniref:adhesion domain-containing protein n=1 Tax=Yersinia bercovieri TaxID=634 RepID=UPI00119C98C4|nr:DUF823 domain-containing adhesin [Yersinia bercovieri]